MRPIRTRSSGRRAGATLIVAVLIPLVLAGCRAANLPDELKGTDRVILQLIASTAVVTADSSGPSAPRVFSQKIEIVEGGEAQRLIRALAKATTVAEEKIRPAMSARITVIKKGALGPGAVYLYDEEKDLLTHGETTYKLPFKLCLEDYRPTCFFLGGEYPDSPELAALRADMNGWSAQAAVLTRVGTDDVLLVTPGNGSALGERAILAGLDYQHGRWRLLFSFEKAETGDPLPFIGTFTGLGDTGLGETGPDRIEVLRLTPDGQVPMPLQDEYVILPELSRDAAKIALRGPVTVTIAAPPGLTLAKLAYCTVDFMDMCYCDGAVDGKRLSAVIPKEHTWYPGVRYHWEMVIDGRFRRTPDVVLRFLPANLTVRAGGPFALYPDAAPESESMRPSPGSVGPGPADVLDAQGDWVQVQQGGVEGWLPKWYFDYGDIPVRPVKSPWKVVTGQTPGLLYPYGPQLLQVSPGNLVKPLMEVGDWVQVRVIVFSLPSVTKAWIPKDVLASPAVFKPNQGFIKDGSEAWLEYDQIGKGRPDVSGPWQVVLREERDGYVLVEAPAGWGGWTKVENITFDGP